MDAAARNAALEALADRIADKVVQRLAAPTPECAHLVDAADAAAILGVSRDYIYRHATELDGVRVGNGMRPRWRFDPARLLARGSALESPTLPRKTKARRHKAGKAVELLPIREDGDR
jgi:hypothetical protein